MKSEMELFLKNLKDKGLEPSKVDETDDEYVVTLGMGMKNTNFRLLAILRKMATRWHFVYMISSM